MPQYLIINEPKRNNRQALHALVEVVEAPTAAAALRASKVAKDKEYKAARATEINGYTIVSL